MKAQPPSPLAWLIKTKLRPPSRRADWIARPHLLAALYAALSSHRLTLLSAPAGYGKTTLLCQLQDLPATVHPLAAPSGREPPLGRRMAWLTLDEGDNDPVLFLHYLVAALRTVVPGCGSAALALLSEFAGSRVQVRQVVAALINDLVESGPEPLVLVLDDLHCITEAAVFTLLDYLLVHLPPPVHVVIATRADPPLSLARLRARGQLAELRLADLRFTEAETGRFLNDALGLDLSPADLETLYRRTEGWAAGLRLLAGSLDRLVTPAERAAFIAEMAQTDRYVFDYLADEVLARQEPEVRAFLLQTSILPELTPALCDFVTGRADSMVVLEDLERRNLFLVPLSPAPSPVYRYHALFAEFLQQRLRREMPEWERELHRRAAQAQRCDRPRRAIEHYLTAEMWEEAAQAIEVVQGEMLQTGLWETVRYWIDALPVPVREAHPTLLHALGACILLGGNDLSEAQRTIEAALRGYTAQGAKEEIGAALAMLSSCAMLQGDFDRCATFAAQALTYPLSPESQVEALLVQTWASMLAGEDAQAAALLEKALSIVQALKTPDLLNVLAFHLNPPLVTLPGALESLERCCRLADAYLTGPPNPLQVSICRVTVFIHFWRGRLDQAIREGEQALALSQRLGGAYALEGDLAATLSRVFIARRAYRVAEQHMARAMAHAERVEMLSRLRIHLLSTLAQLHWLQGRIPDLRRLYAEMASATHPYESPCASFLLATTQARLEMAEKRYAAAENALRRAVTLERSSAYAASLANARLLLAHLYLSRGDPEQALAELTPLLAGCKARGTPGPILVEGGIAVPVLRLAVEQGVHAPFAAHLLTILEAGNDPRPVPIPETGETLTRREVEILRLIAQGLSNRAIAERLVIGEGTVKSHVHRILRKLDATSRTEAVARARQLFPLIFR